MTEDFDKDITRNFHRGDRNSVAASMSMRHRNHEFARAVWDHIEACGEFGATCDETEVALGMLHQTCSALITMLKASGDGEDPRILDTGCNRSTRSGRAAHVYRVIAGRRP